MTDLLPPPGSPDLPPSEGQPVLCPGCATNFPHGTVVCVHCGLNLLTGERLGPPKAPPAETVAEPETALEKFASTFPGLFRPRVLVASLVVFVLSLAAFALCIVLLLAGVVFTAATAGGVGLILYAQAVAWILVGEFQLLVEALSEFDSPRWNAFFIAIGLPLVGAFLVLGLKSRH